MVVFGAVFQSTPLLILAALLLTVIPVAWAWNRVTLWRVSYERAINEQRVFVGESVELSTRLNNRKLLPLTWIKIDDQFPSLLAPVHTILSPSHIPLTGFLTQRAALGSFERARWSYHIECKQRGYFTLGPARLKSGDAFGLFEQTRVSPRTNHLIVYPQILPMEEWGLPPKDPLGDIKTRIPLFEDTSRPRGVRDYRPDDAPKHIHWRATARRGSLQVKQYDPTITYQWVLFLNVATFVNAWEGVNSELLERAISLTASIASYAADHKYSVGMIANGTWPESDQRLKILPSRDPDHLRHVLEALAAVTSFVTTPIETLLSTETSRLSWGATLAVITGVVTEELLAQMLRLRQAGRRLALISLDENWEPQELEGIIVRRAKQPVALTMPQEPPPGLPEKQGMLDGF